MSLISRSSYQYSVVICKLTRCRDNFGMRMRHRRETPEPSERGLGFRYQPRLVFSWAPPTRPKISIICSYLRQATKTRRQLMLLRHVRCVCVYLYPTYGTRARAFGFLFPPLSTYSAEQTLRGQPTVGRRLIITRLTE